MTKLNKAIIGIGLTAVVITAGICLLLVWKAPGQELPEREKSLVLEETEAPKKSETPEETEVPKESPIWEKDTGETQEQTMVSLVIEENPAIYTYEDMEQDLAWLQALHPDVLQLNSLCETADGRQMYHGIIGEETASKHILITASIHAREYMTTQLVMKQLAAFLNDLEGGTESLDDVAVHVIPMINPDGVAISQYGLVGVQKEENQQYIQEIMKWDGSGGTDDYFRRWKANARGVDLNRNFDALWEQYEGSGHPSSDHFKGTAPGSEAETAGLIRLTEKYPFVRTISYHTQGNVIYWYFGQTGTILEETQGFGQAVSSATGYPMETNHNQLDPAGYKDWAISKRGIPSLTIEVGTETSPVPANQFDEIWNRNKGIWHLLIEDVTN